MKEIKYAEPIVSTENAIVTYIGASKGAAVKYGVVFPVPATDSESVDRYGVGLDELIKLGVRAISTRPDYSEAFNADGTADHERLQEIADAYKVGRRAERAPGVKKLSEAVKAAGLTVEEVLALIARAKGN